MLALNPNPKSEALDLILESTCESLRRGMWVAQDIRFWVAAKHGVQFFWGLGSGDSASRFMLGITWTSKGLLEVIRIHTKTWSP